MAGLSWMKLWVGVHSHPKIAALGSEEFRLLTYIWCLAAQSKEPGTVQLTAGVGIDPDQLARQAGCDMDEWRPGQASRGGDMLQALERLALVEVDSAGVIRVHDWDEWNAVPPSKQPERAAEYMRNYREERRKGERRKNVRSVLEGSKKTEEEEEEEEEKEKEEEKKETDLAQSSGKAPTSAPPDREATPFVAFVRATYRDVPDPWALEARALAAFPGIDLLAEALKAHGWEQADPKRRKVKHGRFLWGWFTRAQEGAWRNRPAGEVPRKKGMIAEPSTDDELRAQAHRGEVPF